jgi:hypothetical protein
MSGKINPFKIRDDYFEQSAVEIFSKIDFGNEVFFEKQKQLILAETSQKKEGRSIVMWASVWSAVAAAVVAGWIYWPAPTKLMEETKTFAELLDETELNEEEILMEASDEELALYFSSEIDSLHQDLIIEPTVRTKPAQKLLPKEKEENVDQLLNNLSDEEIIQYLIENGNDEFEIQ